MYKIKIIRKEINSSRETLMLDVHFSNEVIKRHFVKRFTFPLDATQDEINFQIKLKQEEVEEADAFVVEPEKEINLSLVETNRDEYKAWKTEKEELIEMRGLVDLGVLDVNDQLLKDKQKKVKDDYKSDFIKNK